MAWRCFNDGDDFWWPAAAGGKLYNSSMERGVRWGPCIGAKSLGAASHHC
jgi:hypothetical protein